MQDGVCSAANLVLANKIVVRALSCWWASAVH